MNIFTKTLSSALVIIFAGALTLSVTGCWESDAENKIEDVGEAIEDTADDAKDKVDDAVDAVDDEL